MRVTRAAEGILHRTESIDSLLVQAGAIGLAAYSYASLPDRLVSVHSNTFTALRWTAPLLWGLFLVSILIVLPPARFEPLINPLAANPVWRRAAAVLIWMFGLAQLWVISLLVHFLLHNKVTHNGTELIHIAARIEGTTIVITAFIFWLMDSGGPIMRQRGIPPDTDFLWPQLENPQFGPTNWRPDFLDYLYISFTNAIAFSPTDVMPLKARMKMVMMVEAGASAVTLILVAARAVNILNV